MTIILELVKRIKKVSSIWTYTIYNLDLRECYNNYNYNFKITIYNNFINL